jgi:hydrogenase maturation protease
MGNVLRGDDGLGVWVARMVAHVPLSRPVEVVDGGIDTGRMGLVVARRPLTVVIDSARGDEPPGTVRRYRPEEVQPWVASGQGAHGQHLLDLLEENRIVGEGTGPVVLITVEGRDFAWRLGLSPPLVEALPEVVRQVLAVVDCEYPQDVDWRELYWGQISWTDHLPSQ